MLNAMNGNRRSRYRIVKCAGRPILAVPALSLRSKLAGVSRYQPFTQKRAWFRNAVSLAICLGLDRLLGPCRASPFEPDEDFGFFAWLARVRVVFNAPDALATIVWPPQTHRNRIYVHLIDKRRKPVTFCKIALGESDRVSLCHEVRVITTLTEFDLRLAKIPRVLYHETFTSHFYVAYEPMPLRARTDPLPWVKLAPLVEEFSGPIRVIAKKELIQQDWWIRFVPQSRALGRKFLAAVDRAVGRGVSVHRIHGDFTPANIYQVDDVIWVCDWEFSSTSGPRRTDEIAYYLSSHYSECVSHPAEALQEILRSAGSMGNVDVADEVVMALVFLAGRGDAVAQRVASSWSVLKNGEVFEEGL